MHVCIKNTHCILSILQNKISLNIPKNSIFSRAQANLGQYHIILAAYQPCRFQDKKD